jgi:hypothetical protein
VPTALPPTGRLTVNQFEAASPPSIRHLVRPMLLTVCAENEGSRKVKVVANVEKRAGSIVTIGTGNKEVDAAVAPMESIFTSN